MTTSRHCRPLLDKVRRIEAVCRRHGVELPTAALQFPLGHARLASIVAGATKPDEVRRTWHAWRFRFPADLLARAEARRAAGRSGAGAGVTRPPPPTSLVPDARSAMFADRIEGKWIDAFARCSRAAR